MKLGLQVLVFGLVMSLMSCGKGDVSNLVGSWVDNAQTEMMSVDKSGKVTAYSVQYDGAFIGEVSEKEKDVYDLRLDSKFKEESLKGRTGDDLKQAEEMLNQLKYTIRLFDSNTLKVTISVGEQSKEITYTKVSVADRDKVLATVRAGNGPVDQDLNQVDNTVDQPEIPGFGKLF